MGNNELLAKLIAVAEVMAASKKLHEGGWQEAHEKAAAAREMLLNIIHELAGESA